MESSRSSPRWRTCPPHGRVFWNDERMSDEQIAQMYELMLAIRESEVEGNEAEVEARRAAEKIEGKN